MVNIGNWLRQARYRAKKSGVDGSLTVDEVAAVISDLDGRCAYCGSAATALDNPVPFSEGGQNVQANVLPACAGCKAVKRNHSICWMHDRGYISEDIYVRVVGGMLSRNGGCAMKEVLRSLLGIYP